MSPDDDALVRWVAEHDEPCPVCAYNLRSATSAVCPECGTSVRLSVTSPATAMGPLVLAIVSYSLAIGFDLVTLTLVGGMIAVFGPPPGVVPQVAVSIMTLGLLAALCGLGLATLLRSKRRWFRQSGRRQWALAWFTFVVVGSVHAIAGIVLMSIMP